MNEQDNRLSQNDGKETEQTTYHYVFSSGGVTERPFGAVCGGDLP